MLYFILFSVYTSYSKSITYTSNKSTCPLYKQNFVADIKHVTGKSNEPFHERCLTDYKCMLQVKPDIYSNNSQAKILHKIEREITETLTSLDKNGERSLYLSRSLLQKRLAME